MSKISLYPAIGAVVPTAELPIYDPTDVGTPDKKIALSTLAGAHSVANGAADDAEIAVGSEVSNVRDITVQLNDANGDPVTTKHLLIVAVFADAAGAALSSGGSTGLALDSDGLLLDTPVAKKLFTFMTDATGLLTLTWTDTGTVAAYLGVFLPDGRVVIGAAMTNT